MAATWTRPRNELIDVGVDLVRRGYEPRHVAETMVQMHFRGANPRAARRRLAAAIADRFYRVYAGRTERQAAVDGMAAALRAEGWRPLFDEDGERCFWQHAPTGAGVNSNGGFFYCFEAATRAAYGSAVRALLRAREEAA